MCSDILGKVFMLFKKTQYEQYKIMSQPILDKYTYSKKNKFNRYKNNSKKEISIPDIIKKDLETLIS